jgi:hypothetical protein
MLEKLKKAINNNMEFFHRGQIFQFPVTAIHYLRFKYGYFLYKKLTNLIS